MCVMRIKAEMGYGDMEAAVEKRRKLNNEGFVFAGSRTLVSAAAAAVLLSYSCWEGTC